MPARTTFSSHHAAPRDALEIDAHRLRLLRLLLRILLLAVAFAFPSFLPVLAALVAALLVAERGEGRGQIAPQRGRVDAHGRREVDVQLEVAELGVQRAARQEVEVLSFGIEHGVEVVRHAVRDRRGLPRLERVERDALEARGERHGIGEPA
jgi:hypothetical protein